MRSFVRAIIATIAVTAGTPAFAQSSPDARALFAAHCASCHGSDRLGGIGPALLPENLGRLRREAVAEIIAHGREATRMQGFADRLRPGEIAALAALVLTPLPEVPRWGMEEIRDSRVIVTNAAALPERPVHHADPQNLFIVVESGDHHVTILDGDQLEPIHRFRSRFALHGGPKFSPDGRFVFFASRDGWVTKFDLYGLQIVAEVRAGINARNLALSGDGRIVAVANYLPHTLVLLDAANLTPLEVIPALDARGKTPSRVSAVYQAARRGSFIAALKDVPEIWEIFYGTDPPKVYTGLVHSYEKGMVEALPAASGRFPIRRITIDEPLDDFFFDPAYRNLMGSSRDAGKAIVVNLDIGGPIATLDLPGLPHLGSGISWDWQGRPVLATPNLKEGVVSVIDMTSWTVVKRIPTLGPGFFLRGHENSPYAWVDTFLGQQRDTLAIIDTRSLEVVRTLTPAPGKTAGHVEFTRDGRYALVSLWETDGAIVVYDTATFEEVKRIPLSKPSGKYNVWNKTHLSAGTSH